VSNRELAILIHTDTTNGNSQGRNPAPVNQWQNFHWLP